MRKEMTTEMNWTARPNVRSVTSALFFSAKNELMNIFSAFHETMTQALQSWTVL